MDRAGSKSTITSPLGPEAAQEYKTNASMQVQKKKKKKKKKEEEEEKKKKNKIKNK